MRPSKLGGRLTPPPSKSHSLRALLFGALADGKSYLNGILDSPDALAMIRACEAFGAEFHRQGQTTTVKGVGGKIAHSSGPIDVGNSGIVLRFCAAIASLSSSPFTFDGDTSLRRRPMQPLLQALEQLGATTHSREGFAPICLRGPIVGDRVEVEGWDSQFVSALLIAGIYRSTPLNIHVKSPGEIPWIKMTLRWLDFLGVRCDFTEDFTYFRVTPPTVVKGFEYSVPADLSSATYPVAAALMTGSSLCLEGIDLDDQQGDRAFFDALLEMGAKLQYNPVNRRLKVEAGPLLTGGTVDVNVCIDALPLLAVMGTQMQNPLRLINAAVARHKESDRLHAIRAELEKLGAKVTEGESWLEIFPSRLRGGEVISYGDHRIVLSLAVAGMAAEGTTRIADTGCIAKTYPNFVGDLKRVGAEISEEDES